MAHMRIVLVVTGFPVKDEPSRGIFNLRAARSLSEEADIQVVFARAWRPSRPRARSLNVEGIPVFMLPIPQMVRTSLASISADLTALRVLAWPRVRRIFSGADIIHSVGALPLGVTVGWWARRVGAKHINELIGSDVNSLLPRARRLRPVRGWESRVDAFASNSARMAEALRAMYPHAGHIQTVYRGVDLELYSPAGEIAGPLTGVGPVRFLYLGGFPAYRTTQHASNTKGGETLLDAWRHAEGMLIARGANLMLAGPASDQPRIHHWRASLTAPESVTIGGALSPDSIPAVMRASDVVLLPSMLEGLPSVAMEASACGRAVLGSDTGGIPEVVEDGETGRLLHPGDAGALAEALTTAAGDPAQLAEMGARGRARMERLFDARRYGKNMATLYRRVIS